MVAALFDERSCARTFPLCRGVNRHPRSGPEPGRVQGHRGGAGSAHRSGTHAGAGTPFPVLSSQRTYCVPTRSRRHPSSWPTRAAVGPASGRAAAGPAPVPRARAVRTARRGEDDPRVGCWRCVLLLLEHVDLLMGCGVFRLLHGPARTPSPTSGDTPSEPPTDPLRSEPFRDGPGACHTAKVASADWAGIGRFRGSGPGERTGAVRCSSPPARGRWPPCSSAVTRGSARHGSSTASAPRPVTTGVLVLRGVCLPMGATAVPLMPLRTAFRRLPDGVAPPALDGHAPAGGAPVAVDAWLDRTSSRSRRGARRRRRAVGRRGLARRAHLRARRAARPEPCGSADAAARRGRAWATRCGAGWPTSAGCRASPSCTSAPFDRPETGDQLHVLLGASPHESLVTEVQARTGGNAYLNRLLVEGLPPRRESPSARAARRISASAVLRPWERLSRPARELVLAVAIGGEVAAGPALERAADLSGVPPEDAPPAPSGGRRRRGARRVTRGRVLVPPPPPGRGVGVTARWGRTAQDARTPGSSL